MLLTTGGMGARQDHEFGFVVLEIAAAEQRAQNRHLTKAGEAVEILLGRVLQQASDRERSAGGKFNRRFCAAHGKGRYRKALQDRTQMRCRIRNG